jgi:ankyrin repeat protein
MIDNNYDVVEKLIAENPNIVNYVTKIGRTPIMTAASLENIRIARLLIEKGANVNYKDPRGKNAFYYAAIGEGEGGDYGGEINVNMIKFLIENGATVDDEVYSNALNDAKKRSKLNVVNYLTSMKYPAIAPTPSTVPTPPKTSFFPSFSGMLNKTPPKNK